MRWTIDSKEKAIEMLKNGTSISEVSNAFGMSESSVILLKYTKIKNNLERVKCEICGKLLKQISVKHLDGHNISLEGYKNKYPNSKMITEYRDKIYKNFKHPNKGKTYEEIYGEDDAAIKKQKISEKQIGREAPEMAGTGITGTRKDTGMFARSSYEANIDRIFAFENKRIEGEFSNLNNRFDLIKNDGSRITYQPDRVDVDGLFLIDSYLEIKGYMYPEDWEKICLFRIQNPNKKLLVISRDKEYCDINYSELEKKYKDKIPLWEDSYQNYRKNPSIYQINYIEPEIEKFFRENYTNRINNSIIDEHIVFIAKKCVSYCSVRLGKDVYIDRVSLIAISDRRPKSRVSTGKYHYELWEIETYDKEKYYITNQEKTTLFYCYNDECINKINEFFKENNNLNLKYGPKEENNYLHIDKSLVESFERKDILKRVEDIFTHKAIPHIVKKIELVYTDKTKKGALNDREEWKIDIGIEKYEYKLTNIGNATMEYKLIEKINEL